MPHLIDMESLFEFSYHLARITISDYTIRYVANYHCPRANHHIVAYCNSGYHNRACANPTAFSHSHAPT